MPEQVEMQSKAALPGTGKHQKVLQAIINYYAGDARILAVIVFGSLGRGNWDALSDVDLDIIVRDNAHIDIESELKKICAVFAEMGDTTVSIYPQGDEADILLESLLQLSIRWHTLDATNPNIVSSMRLLAGELDLDSIAAAGQANRTLPVESIEHLVSRGLQLAAYCSVYLLRGQTWLTIDLLHRLRLLLIEIFARTHAGERSLQTFEALAEAELQRRLGETLPGFGEADLRQAFMKLLDLLEKDLPEISAGQVNLKDAERRILEKLRRRLEALPPVE